MQQFIPLLYLNSSLQSSTFFNLQQAAKTSHVLRSLNGESGRASHLVYKFDKQIARCNNSQIKILYLFEFPYVLAA